MPSVMPGLLLRKVCMPFWTFSTFHASWLSRAAAAPSSGASWKTGRGQEGDLGRRRPFARERAKVHGFHRAHVVPIVIGFEMLHDEIVGQVGMEVREDRVIECSP